MNRVFILSGLIFCLLAFSQLGCSGDTPFSPASNLPVGRVQAINIIPGILWIQEGKIYRFEARGIFPGGAVADVTFLASWNIDNPDVAVLIGPGLVRAERPGLAYVTCTYDGVTSSTGTVAIPGIPLEKGIVPVHVEVFPGAVTIPITEVGTLSFVPTAATPFELGLPSPKPALMYALGEAGRDFPIGFWADSTIRITSGAGAGLEFEIISNYTSQFDTDPGDPTHPYGPDWIPDGIAVFLIDDGNGFPADWGILAGDTYQLNKRWVQFSAIADFSDGSKGDVTFSSKWHISDPTFGFVTSSGLFKSTSAQPTNLVIHCEFSGLISNYVPVAVR